ncbi:MAG: M23 family metallopeptidase [Pseudomonadota bacterium]
MDRRRYLAQSARNGSQGTLAYQRPGGLETVARGRARHTLRDVYEADHAEAHKGGRFRWLLSTCLAGMVGAVAILVVINGSLDTKDAPDGLMPALKRLQEGTAPPMVVPQVKRAAGLNWAFPKSDRLEVISDAVTTRYVIHESLKQQRDGRTYIRARPYLKISAKLGPVPKNFQDVIPPFNPFKLYTDSNPIGRSDGNRKVARDDVEIRVVELLGGILPNEDGQELATNEVVDIINQARQSDQAEQQLLLAAERGGFATAGNPAFDPDSNAPNTSVLEKSVIESDDEVSDYEGGRKVILKAGDNDSLRDLLLRQGSEPWVVDGLLEAAARVWTEATLSFGQEVHITMVPSLTDPNRMEPARLSLFSFGHNHLVTVSRSSAGDFEATTDPLPSAEASQKDVAARENQKSMSLYASVYYAALLQQIPPETINRILKTHAYDTDFRRRVRPGDSVEFFFELKDENLIDGPPGDLLYTQIISGGETSRFFRFRSGVDDWDFYSADGNNSRRFLLPKPVSGNGVRLTSGFGMRNHPLLNRRKMHNGVDWAARTGTPILAAGKGTITFAGRKGANGNYVRIRHANGYQTSYSHMRRFAPGVKAGVRVRQGQVIGYIGSTGLSSGPHLHFEVLVNKRPVNPMKIKVGNERQLDGKDLRAFQRERARLDSLMRRTPVMTSSK